MKNKKEIRLIFFLTAAVFLAFLAVPVVSLLVKSVLSDTGFTTAFYKEVFGTKGFLQTLGRSFLAAGASALTTTLLAFLLAYTVHYTNAHRIVKKIIGAAAVLPMLLPTITYGFAIMYSFGKEGLLTRLFGGQFFSIYGFM